MAGKGLKNVLNTVKASLVEEEKRARLQFLCVYVIFCLVSVFMTVVNAITGYRELMWFTLVFGVLNIVNVLFSIREGTVEKIVRGIFAVEIVALTTSFTVLGQPEGFSAIWTALIPACVLLLYRKKYGTIISLVQFLILILLFWTPLKTLLIYQDYTKSFMLRFPLLYSASYAVGLLFEWVRSVTQEELNEQKESYKKLSYTDKLTGLGNESLYLRTVQNIERKQEKESGNAKYALLVMDVNGVKVTNDAYGHRYGCHLIVTAGKTLPTIFPTSQIFHIGGDEFVAIVKGKDYDELEKRLALFDEKLSYRKIEYDGKELTLSVARGVAVYQAGDKFAGIFQQADDNMYKNKCEVKEKYDIPLR